VIANYFILSYGSNFYFRFFKRFFDESGKVKIGGNDFFVALGGDKGYYNVEQIGETVVFLTESAAHAEHADNVDAAADNEEATKATRGRTKAQVVTDFLKEHKNAVLDASFSSDRAVVERVFGWLKERCQFLDGPIWASQAGALAAIVQIMCAVHNKLMLQNLHMHVRENSASVDDEEEWSFQDVLEMVAEDSEERNM
jgi:hypothetical protein